MVVQELRPHAAAGARVTRSGGAQGAVGAHGARDDPHGLGQEPGDRQVPRPRVSHRAEPDVRHGPLARPVAVLGRPVQHRRRGGEEGRHLARLPQRAESHATDRRRRALRPVRRPHRRVGRATPVGRRQHGDGGRRPDALPREVPRPLLELPRQRRRSPTGRRTRSSGKASSTSRACLPRSPTSRGR